MLVLEDCHWIDPLSRDLLEALGAVGGRAAGAVRPRLSTGRRRRRRARRRAHPATSTSSRSTELDADDAAELIRSKLAQVLGAETPAHSAAISSTLVTDRAQGNPFYIEELVNFIAVQGVDSGTRRRCETLELPESLHSLVLTRIDSWPRRRGGRSRSRASSVAIFEAPTLPGAYPELGELPDGRRTTSTRCAAPTSSRLDGKPSRPISSSTS